LAGSEPVVIVLRRLESPRELVSPRLADDYQVLADAARRGDAAAAEALARALEYCARAYSDETSLSRARSILAAERRFVPADGSPPLVFSSAEDIGAIARELLDDPYEYCQNHAGAEQTAAARGYLEQSAKAGNLFAIRSLARKLAKSDASRAEELWRAAWESGDTAATEHLGRYHLARGKALAAANDSRASSEQVVGFAYLLINTAVLEATIGASGTRAGRRLADAHRQNLDAAGAALNPQEHAAASAKAKDLLTSNARCCVSAW
jgi:hypothetical protein